MRFPRLLAVFLGVVLACGVFGAAVGALIGISLPGGARSAEIQRHVETDSSSEPGIVLAERPRENGRGSKGAALGGALGLVLGVVLGVPIALLDQAIVIGRSMLAKHGDGPPEAR